MGWWGNRADGGNFKELLGNEERETCFAQTFSKSYWAVNNATVFLTVCWGQSSVKAHMTVNALGVCFGGGVLLYQ
jgi:hypothetical protein